jgi:hypothetical protein
MLAKHLDGILHRFVDVELARAPGTGVAGDGMIGRGNQLRRLHAIIMELTVLKFKGDKIRRSHLWRCGASIGTPFGIERSIAKFAEVWPDPSKRAFC